jgi:hypothetical protein
MNADTGTHQPNSSVTQTISPQPRFHLGRLLATPAALRTLEEFGVQPLTLRSRHVRGDWGDLCTEDQRANSVAIEDGSRIFSSYMLTRTKDGQTVEATVWLITERAVGGKRSHSTLLLPNEY